MGSRRAAEAKRYAAFNPCEGYNLRLNMSLKTEFSIYRKLFLVVLLCSGILAYRWISSHVWFASSDCKLLVNGSFSPMLYDYLPGRSLNGDIFLRNQDHGTQYLISVKRREVSVISEDEHFIDIGLLTYTQDALTGFENPRLKTKLSNPNLLVGNRFVEFNASENEPWHVSD